MLDYPKELSPFAKDHRSEPGLVERFECFAAGMEFANAFTELNDPDEQRARFEQQARDQAAGDDETQPYDEDYVRALEHGMPPTGGIGIGIDRLVMILSGRHSIREVVLFPAHARQPCRGPGMTVVLVTGMSGTGKSAALAELASRGHRVVDTDYGAYSEEVPCSDAGGWEQLWREDRIDALLDEHGDGVLFISGCVSNQGKFYPRFDAVVLLSAPANVILERVAGRESNAFGKRDSERDRILDDLAKVEPLLRARATAEIDTRAPLDEVVDALESLANAGRLRS